MQSLVAFRVDWSHQLGLGHRQRCLALAEALQRIGVASVLLARPGPTTSAHDVGRIDIRWLPDTQAGRPANSTPPLQGSPNAVCSQADDARASIELMRAVGADAVIVDSYEHGAHWESKVTAEVGIPVVAIDGGADRSHTADLVIAPSSGPQQHARWEGLLTTRTRLLEGPRYALIHPDFGKHLAHTRQRDGKIERLLVNFGGTDPLGLTSIALEAVASLTDHGLATDVVVGAGYVDPAPLRRRCESLPLTNLYHGTSRMAELMANADLAIGAGGVTTYERAFLGLPAIVIVAADNQSAQVAETARIGAVRALGAAAKVSADDLARATLDLIDHPENVRRMSDAARAMMDHDSVPGSVRVADEIAALL